MFVKEINLFSLPDFKIHYVQPSNFFIITKMVNAYVVILYTVIWLCAVVCLTQFSNLGLFIVEMSNRTQTVKHKIFVTNRTKIQQYSIALSLIFILPLCTYTIPEKKAIVLKIVVWSQLHNIFWTVFITLFCLISGCLVYLPNVALAADFIRFLHSDAILTILIKMNKTWLQRVTFGNNPVFPGLFLRTKLPLYYAICLVISILFFIVV